jgi:Flp pilus assembly protein TadD
MNQRPGRLRSVAAIVAVLGLAMIIVAASVAGSWRTRERWRARDLEQQATLALATGNRAEALSLFASSAAYEHTPETVEGLRRLGSEALGHHGEEPLARDAFRLLTKLTPDDPEAWFALGTAAAASADYGTAVEGFGRAEKLRPEWLEARANQGICLVWDGEPKRAREVLLDLVGRLTAPPAELLCALARAELERVPADRAAAREAYTKALTADPKCAEAALGLALVANQAGDAKEREAQLEKARLLDPNSADVFVAVGALHARAGKEDEAREDLSLALAIAPHHAVAHYDLGCLYLRQRDGRKAEAQFRAAVESSPEDPLARLGWALALRLEGRSEEAERQLEEALDRRPPHAAVQLAHAELRKLGPPEAEPDPSERMSAPIRETPKPIAPEGESAPASVESLSTTPRVPGR